MNTALSKIYLSVYYRVLHTMEIVTKHRIIVAALLTILLFILYYHAQKTIFYEGFQMDDEKVDLYAINLDKDKDRYAKLLKHYMKSDFSKHQKLHRFPAIVGKQEDPKKWLTSDAFNELLLIEKNGYRTHHHSITRGGLGCFLSHYYLAKKLVEDKTVDCYLILEDDTTLYPLTYKKITKAMKHIPDDWDMALFYTIRAVGKRENEQFNRIKSFWGTNCYLLNKKGAEKLVKEVEETNIDGQIDSYLSRMIQQNKFHVYASQKHLVMPNSSETNIQARLKPHPQMDPYDFKGYKM